MLKAAGYRILIKPDEIVKKTAGGIIINYGPNEQVEKNARTTGIVVDVSPDAWTTRKHPWAKVGDRVMWALYAGKLVIDPETDEELVVMNDEDITLVVHNGG